MTKIRFAIVFFVLILTGGTAWAQMSPDEALDRFVKAGFAYQEGKYFDAAEGYEAIVRAGWESGPVFYNLANSYFRQGQLGLAVLNYRRALRLIPRDPDLSANYHYAVSLVQPYAQAMSESVPEKLLRKVLRHFTLNEWVSLALWCWMVWLAVYVFWLYISWGRGGRVVVLTVGAAAFLAFSAGGVCKYFDERDVAVTVADAAAKYEPRDEATTYFELSQGSEVKVLKSEGGWVKLQRPDRKTGWVPRGDIERVN